MSKSLFTKEEWKQNLIGCAEVLLFMHHGISRFKTSRRAAIKSFIIPLVLLPIVLSVFVLQSSGFSMSLLLSLHMLRIALALILFFAAVYFLSRQYDRQEHFYHFMNVTNWSNIQGILLILPIVIGLLAGYDMAIFESYAVFITLVGYVYSAFIVTYCFRFPWEFGGFIAIVGMAIDQNLLELATFLRDMIAA
ncbi:MAG: hypothetical protein ACRBDL_11085 [Alphaproteobacteria bacterium]